MDKNTSTFTIGGISHSVDSFKVAESFVLRINISGKNPAHRKCAKRYRQYVDNRQIESDLFNINDNQNI